MKQTTADLASVRNFNDSCDENNERIEKSFSDVTRYKQYRFHSRKERIDPVEFYFDGETTSLLFARLEKRTRELEATVAKLKDEQQQFIKYRFQTISFEDAKKRVTDFLDEIKDTRRQTSVFELSQSLNLPADQVDLILDALEEGGRVTTNG